jgi:hypothetical protein
MTEIENKLRTFPYEITYYPNAHSGPFNTKSTQEPHAVLELGDLTTGVEHIFELFPPSYCVENCTVKLFYLEFFSKLHYASHVDLRQ